MKSGQATTGLESEIMLCETGQAWGVAGGLTHPKFPNNSTAQNLRL